MYVLHEYVYIYVCMYHVCIHVYYIYTAVVLNLVNLHVLHTYIYIVMYYTCHVYLSESTRNSRNQPESNQPYGIRGSSVQRGILGRYI